MRLRAARDAAAEAFARSPRPARKLGWLEASWCALDLELTGLDPSHDEIIAVGTVPVEAGRVQLGSAHYTLVRTGKRSEEAAILTHKLLLAELADAPPIDDALDLIFESLAGRVPVFHTAAVERAFLAPLFRRRRARLPPAADTEALGRAWLERRDGKAPSWVSLAGLSRALGQPPEPEHHALADALTTAKAFIALATHLGEQTVGTLLSASERPRRMG